MENRYELYGNIKDTSYKEANTSCAAFCGCACSCGFCVGVQDKSEDLESSELVTALLESE